MAIINYTSQTDYKMIISNRISYVPRIAV